MMQLALRKGLIKRSLYIVIFAFLLTIIASVLTFIINPELKDSMGNSLDSSGLSRVWDYVKNNGFLVPLQMFILALIPIQFLYLVNIIVTNIALGFFIGVALRIDLYEGMSLTIASIPHTALEIFAYCLFAAILFDLNRSIRSLIGNLVSKKKKRVSLGIRATEMLKIYIVFVFPLIVIAALLETYLADYIYQLLT